MMINKRLISTVTESKKYIMLNVFFQWCSLLANVVIMGGIAYLLGIFYQYGVQHAIKMDAVTSGTRISAICIVIGLCVRFLCTIVANRMSYLSSKAVKRTLRERIFAKLLKLGTSYEEKVHTSEIVQVAVEGVDQLEIYFGAYLPQFFYAMLAPFTLFVILCFVNVPSALVLLVCVPLIPVSIAVVQTWAKKLLSKYWGQYTALGDTFLENLQGLTTLKIYQADEFKNQEMNEEAEKFRKITMKVLTMQLNSITIMDLIAYGGAALGIIMATTQLRAGKLDVMGCLFIILVAADFFIPMRQLGSFFHIAMNGMAASDKIFRLLDLPEIENHGLKIGEDTSLLCNQVRYTYDGEREILHGIDMEFPRGQFTAIVGESGCGKSTIAGILMGKNKGYAGKVQVGGLELKDIAEDSLLERMTYIGHQSYLFKGTVRENLCMANKSNTLNRSSSTEQENESGKSTRLTDEKLWTALDKVKLSDYIRAEGGLEMKLQEKASNLSGGQAQRLALARALLHNSEVYIFDEATSNIDMNSENDIMEEVYDLAKEKTVIMISHRLANVVSADNIYVLNNGDVVEQGQHEKMLTQRGFYQQLWNTQQNLEQFGTRKEA